MIKLFGKNFKETVDFFNKKGGVRLGVSDENTTPNDNIKNIGRIVVSIVILVVAVYLVINNGNDTLAGTLFGAVSGYWLS